MLLIGLEVRTSLGRKVVGKKNSKDSVGEKPFDYDHFDSTSDHDSFGAKKGRASNPRLAYPA